MKYATTITPKYQVHIPAAVRRQVGLTGHGRAYIRAEGTRIIIEPNAASFSRLSGAFTVKKPVPAEKLRGVIGYGDKK